MYIYIYVHTQKSAQQSIQTNSNYKKTETLKFSKAYYKEYIKSCI